MLPTIIDRLFVRRDYELAGAPISFDEWKLSLAWKGMTRWYWYRAPILLVAEYPAFREFKVRDILRAAYEDHRLGSLFYTDFRSQTGRRDGVASLKEYLHCQSMAMALEQLLGDDFDAMKTEIEDRPGL